VRRRFLQRQIDRLSANTELPPDAQADAISPQYAAGFFDGEGSVSICKTKVAAWPRPYYTFQVNITNTDLEVLTRMQRTFGGSVKKRKREKRKWKQCYVLRLCSWDAFTFLQRIAPFVIVKRRQAEVGIEFQQTMRHVGNRWGPTSQQEWDRREALYRKIRRLNARGR
jgi:hypothetical protein